MRFLTGVTMYYKTYTEIEATPEDINEESMKETKPEKAKKKFWCCC